MKKSLGPWITLSIVIVCVLVGIYIIVAQDDRDRDDYKIYQSFDLFVKIDDIAHQEIMEDPEESPFTTEKLKESFYTIDDKYHQTRDLQKKYIVMKEMVVLLKEVEKTRPHVEDDENADLEKDKEYLELLEQFDEIK